MVKWGSSTEEGKGYNKLHIKMMMMKMGDMVKNRKMVAASDENKCECCIDKKSIYSSNTIQCIRKLKNQIYH